MKITFNVINHRAKKIMVNFVLSSSLTFLKFQLGDAGLISYRWMVRFGDGSVLRKSKPRCRGKQHETDQNNLNVFLFINASMIWLIAN